MRWEKLMFVVLDMWLGAEDKSSLEVFFEQTKGKQIKENEKQNPMDLWEKKTLSSSTYIYEVRF